LILLTQILAEPHKRSMTLLSVSQEKCFPVWVLLLIYGMCHVLLTLIHLVRQDLLLFGI